MHILATGLDPVRLSFLQALLRDAGIPSTVLDAHVSAVEGGIGAFPRRLLVREADRKRARALLVEAGFGGELRPE